jgi:hypothetical protein
MPPAELTSDPKGSKRNTIIPAPRTVEKIMKGDLSLNHVNSVKSPIHYYVSDDKY